MKFSIVPNSSMGGGAKKIKNNSTVKKSLAYLSF